MKMETEGAQQIVQGRFGGIVSKEV